MSQAIGRTMLAYHRSWRHVNAENQIVGRLATNIAALLMGKHKPIYDPASDCGDHVVVTNSRYLLMTGRKTAEKVYYRHSGRPGHLKVIPLKKMVEKKGTGDILRRAVSGMLPKNKLRNMRLSRLKIFEEDNAGAMMKNVIRRFDTIVIPSQLKKTPNNTAEEVTTNLLKVALTDKKPATKAQRQDDTPPLGSLGGLNPIALSKPKVKPPKARRKKPAPGLMKIFDSQGRQWGRQKWKETNSVTDVVDIEVK